MGKTDLNEKPVVRTCKHCGVSLTAEWDDELCVCGRPAPEKETPRRIQLGPSQQKRGMGKGNYRYADKKRQQERRANMTPEQKAELAKKQRARRSRKKEESGRARNHRPVSGGVKPKRW